MHCLSQFLHTIFFFSRVKYAHVLPLNMATVGTAVERVSWGHCTFCLDFNKALTGQSVSTDALGTALTKILHKRYGKIQPAVVLCVSAL